MRARTCYNSFMTTKTAKQSENVYEPAPDESSFLYIKKHRQFSTETLTQFCHFHDAFELIFVKSGTFGVRWGGRERILTRGETAFVDSFSPHFYFDTDHSEAYIVVIGKDLIVGFDQNETFPPLLPSEECSAKICDYIDSVGDDFTANDSMRAGVANTIMGYLRICFPTVRRTYERASETMIEVLKYIDKNFAEDLSLKGLSAKFGYVPNYFSDLFNKFTDMHLKEYVNRRRVNEVVRLKALRPDEPLFRLSTECGFKSEKTFYRAYRKYKR